MPEFYPLIRDTNPLVYVYDEEEEAWQLYGELQDILKNNMQHVDWTFTDENKCHLKIFIELPNAVSNFSGSGSGLAAPAPGLAAIIPGASNAANVSDSDSKLSENQKAAIIALDIPKHLVGEKEENKKRVSLQRSWQQFKALNDAVTEATHLSDAKKYPPHLPKTQGELMKIFTNRTTFFSYWKKVFIRVPAGSLLQKWLENVKDDVPDDVEVWGVHKAVYYFKDLTTLLDNLEEENQARVKKGKGKQREKQRDKEIEKSRGKDKSGRKGKREGEKVKGKK
ncbi:hypothetical protein EVG20_g10599 [Dentipellis fragilis]|uniref:Uncharacterized protein n=1 Tax=Dentipellis fragilis TaxID=205917 RepID=A0A4Y9XSF2_9AGAM|nr:hypothetical protein EVG20_g10599 [Dentipellis fragilis]